MSKYSLSFLWGSRVSIMLTTFPFWSEQIIDYHFLTEWCNRKTIVISLRLLRNISLNESAYLAVVSLQLIEYHYGYFLQVMIELELKLTLGSRKTGKKEYRVMIKKNENIYKFKTKMIIKWMERKEKLLAPWSFDNRMLRFQKSE